MEGEDHPCGHAKRRFPLSPLTLGGASWLPARPSVAALYFTPDQCREAEGACTDCTADLPHSIRGSANREGTLTVAHWSCPSLTMFHIVQDGFSNFLKLHGNRAIFPAPTTPAINARLHSEGYSSAAQD